MRKLLLFLWCMSLLALSGYAQTYIDEDFSTGSVATPPTGWTNNHIAGDPLIDVWNFDNPGSRTLNAPISDPAAIFDSDNLSNDGLAENAALESPTFDASGASVVILEFDHYFNDGAGGAGRVEVFDGTSWVEVRLDSIGDSPNPESVSIDISAEAAGVSNAQVRFRFTGNWSWYWIVDNVKVFTPFANDLGVVAIEAPTDPDPASCDGLSANEQITISIKNFGTSTQTSFTASWTVLGPGAPVTAVQPVAGVNIPPDSTISYSFTGIAATADMSANGMYTVIGRVNLTGDGDSTNDTTFVNINNPGPMMTPYSEDFETGTPGSGGTNSPGVLPMGWSRTSQSSYAWQMNDGPTGSTNTGPNVDHTTGTNTGLYVYTESSSGSVGDTAELISPCIDITGVASPFLSYWYHMYGGDIGTLEVIVASGGVQTVVQTFTGEQQTSNGEAWRRGLVDLGAFSGTIQIILRGIGNGIFDGDIAIDDLEVVDLPANDIGITAITAPVDGMGCDGLSASESVTVTIENFGAAPQTGFFLGYQVGLAGTPVIETYTGAPIPAGGTASYTFAGTADLSVPGMYLIGAATGLIGDADNSNDSTTVMVNHPAPIPGPIVEDFETFVSDGNFSGNGTGLMNDWMNTPAGPTSGYVWSVRNGTTGSSSTGPNVDHTIGSASGTYMYTESSGTSAGDTAELISPCVDINSLTFPYLSFWYHMYGSNIGTLEASIVQNGVETQLWTISGEQQSSGNAPWEQVLIDLSAYSGSAQILFRAINAGSTSGDLAIDDVGLINVPPFDMAVTDIDAPTVGCFDTTLEEVLVSITNTGTDSIDLFNDTLTIILTATGANPGADTMVLGGSGLGLAVGASYDPPFPFMVNLSNVGVTTLTVTISYTADGEPSNDTLSVDVITQPIISSYPYFEDFESGDGGWVLDENSENSSWAFGTPAKTVIMGAASGSNAWVTGGLGTDLYQDNDNSAIQSPCFDMSNAPAGAWVAMKIWYESEFSWDGAVLQSSVDSGATWQNVGALNAPNNWYNDGSIGGGPGGQQIGWTGRNGAGSNGWVQASHPLDTSLIGAPDVRFRVAFGSDGSGRDDGFAFDDFAIGVPPTVALGNDTTDFCIGEQLDAGSGFASYMWSTGDSTQTISIMNMTGMNIMDSTISVTVLDSLGLPGSDTIVANIFGAAPPAITATQITNVACAGDSTGAIALTLTGDATPFTFAWDNGATDQDLMNLPAGTYSVTVADTNGCSVSSSSFSVSQPEPLTLTNADVMGVDCPDDSTGSIMITVTGGTGSYSYSWSNGDTTQNLANLPVGMYVGTVTDSNMCVLVSDTVDISSAGEFPVAAIADTLSGPSTVDFTGSGGDTYVWDFGDGSDPDSTQNPSHTYASNDTFTVTLIVSNDCGSDTTTASVVMTSVGIADDLLSQHVKVYPNPNQGHFEIRFLDITLEEVAVTVSTVEGKRVYARSLGDIGGAFTHKVTLPSTVARGMYLLQVTTADAVMHKRLIVE